MEELLALLPYQVLVVSVELLEELGQVGALCPVGGGQVFQLSVAGGHAVKS